MKMLVNDLVQAQLAHRVPSFSEAHPRWAIWLGELVRMRFQVLVGLALTVFLPILIRRGPTDLFSLHTYSDPAPLGNVVAFLLGFYIYRRISAFPGVRATSSVIPSFGVSYGLVAALYLFLRVDYRAGEFGASFLVALVFFHGVCFAFRRVRRLAMIVIPGGRTSRLLERSSQIDWYLAHTVAEAESTIPLVADFRADLSPEWERFIADCALAGRPVYNYKQLEESITGRIRIDHISENVFGTLVPNEIWASSKRYADFVLAIAALVVSFVPMAIIALLIRLESKGPAIFRQERVGYRGEKFTIYKFRTMRLLTPKEEAENSHHHDADRITRFGAFLRRSRLDELPQIFNIIKGEMSWIGPRPEAMSLSAQYEAHLPFYRYRHIVRPGVTGWAQVNQGHVVGISSADDKLQYDFFYIRNFSLWLDVLIALRTVRVILTAAGAR